MVGSSRSCSQDILVWIVKVLSLGLENLTFCCFGHEPLSLDLSLGLEG